MESKTPDGNGVGNVSEIARYQIPVIMRDRDMVISDMVGVWRAERGSVTSSLPCIVCGDALSWRPWTMHIVTWNEQCQTGAPHLLSASVVRHLDCLRPDDAQLYSLIIDKCPTCYS